jgi:Uma2 family endonuclease
MKTLMELCPTPEGRKRWRRDECDYLENARLLIDRYELIDGEIISKKGQNRPHALAVSLLLAYLFSLFGARRVQTQATMEVRQADQMTNRPEPDAVVLREPTNAVPTGEDVLLAVEVSDSTQYDDYGHKVRLYARAGVAEYWVLDLNRRVLVAFRDPCDDEWLSRTEYTETDSIAPMSAPDAAILIAELLPSEELPSA